MQRESKADVTSAGHKSAAVTESQVSGADSRLRIKGVSPWNLPVEFPWSPEFERTMIRVALQRCEGRRQDAAKLLGWGRNTLTRKLKELGME